MSLPDFTSDEQYLISAAKADSQGRFGNTYMWSYIVSTALIAGFAAYNESVLMLASAFVVVCGFRVYEETWQARWGPMWKSIIEKYERAAAEGNAGTPD
ncbi:MAG: hypothetical protein AAGJ46_17940 [Planctomycetota bacterium]